MIIYKIIKRFAWRPMDVFKVSGHIDIPGKWTEIHFRWYYMVEVNDDTSYAFTIGNEYYDYRSAFERMKEQIISTYEEDKRKSVKGGN